MESKSETQAAQPHPEMIPSQLTAENFQKGFLVDDELMAGVTEDQADEDHPHRFLAFVIRHTTGEYLGCHAYADLDSALSAINRIPRSWSYEKAGGCGGCGGEGGCSGGGCGKGQCGSGQCAH